MTEFSHNARALFLTAVTMIALASPRLDAQQSALADGASMLAFSRIYLYSGLVLVFALPLLLLFRTGRARGSMGPVH